MTIESLPIASLAPGLHAPVPSVDHPTGLHAAAPGTARDAGSLRAVAEQFEAAFLAEMLTHAGLGEMPETFNGGTGERTFASFLVREYAEEIAATRPIGIADAVMRALAAPGGGRGEDGSR